MAIAYVQLIGSDTKTTSGSTNVITVPAGGVAQGHHVIVGCGTDHSAGSITASAADSRGNTYQLDRVHDQTGTNMYAFVLSAYMTTALQSGDTITVTYSGSTNGRMASAHEYSGLASSSWLDQVNSGEGLSTSPNSGNVTTTLADELLIGVCCFNNTVANYTAGASYTERDEVPDSTQSRVLEVEERIVSSTGTYSASGTITSQRWAQIIATYKKAGTPPANTVAPAVTGTTRVGSTLTTGNGTWTDDGSPTFTYQWQRDNLGDTSYVNISSATASTYVLVGADALCNVRCRVTDTDTGGNTTASSNAVGPITSINFDASSSSDYQAAASTYNWSHTCSSGSNRLLLVGVTLLTGGTVSGITYNGVALTLARGKTNGLYRSELWYLVAPASGAHSVAVTLSASLTSIASAVSYTGAHQTTPIDVLADASGTGNPASSSVTTPTNYDWVVDLIATSDTAISVGGSQTSRQNKTGATGSGAISDIGPVSPAGAQAMSWTGIGVADTWAYVVAGIDDAADPPVYLEPAQDATMQICANGTDDGVVEVFSSGLKKLLLLGVG